MKIHFEKLTGLPGELLLVKEVKAPKFPAPLHFHPQVEITLIVESSGKRLSEIVLKILNQEIWFWQARIFPIFGIMERIFQLMVIRMPSLFNLKDFFLAKFFLNQ